MKETVTFGHGLLCGDYEEQANKQGYTLGERSEHFKKVRDAFFRLRLNGYFSDSETDAILRRVNKDLYNSLKKKEERK